MADETQNNNITTDKPGPLPNEGQSIDRLPVVIHAQYIRDLSFENPNAPMPLQKSEGKPSIAVDFSMDARKLENSDIEDAFEVVLYVSVKAAKGESVTFIAELEYGMMVSVQDVPEDKIHPLLLIEMPNFPYVRQIISDVTANAGYMPFYLTPVNFKALYRKQFGGPKPTVHKAKSETAAETEAEAEKQTA